MSFRAILELAHAVTHLIKGGVELAEELKPVPVLSPQELFDYLVSSCEETSKNLPKSSASFRFDSLHMTPGSRCSVTYVYTLLDVDRNVMTSMEIQKVLENERADQISIYSGERRFEKVCRVNGVLKEFVFNDKHGRKLGVNKLAPSDLK